LKIVVDLAVKNDPGAAVLIGDGLLASGQIDDREAAHAETDATVYVKAVFVRTAVPDRLAHARQQRFVHGFSVMIYYAYDSTHCRKNLFDEPKQIKAASLSTVKYQTIELC